MNTCKASLDRDALTIGNSRISRSYTFNNGHLISRDLRDLIRGVSWEFDGACPDLFLPGNDEKPTRGLFKAEPFAGNSAVPPHLQVLVETTLGALQVRRAFRLYDDCPAIACDLFFRGSTSATWTALAALNLGNIEDPAAVQARAQTPVMERLAFKAKHSRVVIAQFFDATDHRNNLVNTRSIVPYFHESALQGNLLMIQDPLQNKGIFTLKEAPCSDVQLANPGFDFLVSIGCIRMAGIGLLPSDLKDSEWTRGYGFVTGIASSDEFDLLSGLRTYQENARRTKSGRDHMILLNTWGDRGQDKKICEDFCRRELDAGARLGVTHFQIDDGWQTGQSSNSASAGGSLKNIWANPDYWKPHPSRFPRGFGPLVDLGKQLGIEVCLWFNPSSDNSYANWRNDADTLIGFFKQYGIRTFKIDGVMLADKTADIHFRKMLDTVSQATNLEAVFNLDVTAGRRWGYHHGVEYGNMFLENRYTDWSNYHPFWTLRNLWMLSRFVPPQRLQIEFLNVWRNAEKYAADDPFAPRNIPFDYAFAIAMAAQPLAWFEAQNLPEEAFRVAAPVIRVYRQHMERIHAGQIFPIGEEPSGCSWTGLQSITGNHGYFIVFREHTPRPEAILKTWGLTGRKLECTALAGSGSDFVAEVDEGGCLRFALPKSHSFALYQYEAWNRP
jgi:hypothetical protein